MNRKNTPLTPVGINVAALAEPFKTGWYNQPVLTISPVS